MRDLGSNFVDGLSTVQLAIEQIEVTDRLRDTYPSKVAQLRASIGRTGLLFPIRVCRTAAGGYRLIDGQHRLAAARQLGVSTILALVDQRILADDEIKLAEAEANLHGGMSLFEQIVFTVTHINAVLHLRANFERQGLASAVVAARNGGDARAIDAVRKRLDRAETREMAIAEEIKKNGALGRVHGVREIERDAKERQIPAAHIIEFRKVAQRVGLVFLREHARTAVDNWKQLNHLVWLKERVDCYRALKSSDAFQRDEGGRCFLNRPRIRSAVGRVGQARRSRSVESQFNGRRAENTTNTPDYFLRIGGWCRPSRQEIKRLKYSELQAVGVRRSKGPTALSKILQHLRDAEGSLDQARLAAIANTNNAETADPNIKFKMREIERLHSNVEMMCAWGENCAFFGRKRKEDRQAIARYTNQTKAERTAQAHAKLLEKQARKANRLAKSAEQRANAAAAGKVSGTARQKARLNLKS